jgi:transposase-like protein
MPDPYSKEFRDDVVAVARRRDPKTAPKRFATEFGISESCLANSSAKADREDGIRSGATSAEFEEHRAVRRRNPLLEEEDEVLRRTAAQLSRANLPGRSPTRSSRIWAH